MILRFLVFFAVLTFLEVSYAQEAILPRFMTEEEKAQWPGYLEELKVYGDRQLLPEVPVRVMGEWEEIQALFLTWRSFPAILTEIVRHAVEEVKVYIITTNPNSVSNTLINAGIALDSVRFLNYPSNSIWIRDYGPWAVYENDVEQLAIADFVYNRPRANDNNIPARVAETFGLPLYGATAEPNRWVHTGGNNLVDGYKTGYSSNLIFVENPGKSEEDLDRMGKALFGYEDYVKFEELPYDGISHLDMHMRFIDEETVIIGQYPEGVSDGPQIEENIQYLLDNHKTAFGNAYTVHRIPMPPGADGRYPWQGGPYRTYTNSIFLNKTILVPIYEERYDTVGLRIYRENLPGYKVVGIDCNGMISSLGALHCITKTIGVENPLWIAHPRVKDQDQEDLAAEVRALVKHRQGIDQVILHFRNAQDSVYQSLPMQRDSASADFYQAWIPGQSFGTEMHYYIEAISHSGKRQVRPITAPEGYFKYKVTQVWDLPVVDLNWDLRSDCEGFSVAFENNSRGTDLSFLWTFPGGVPSSSSEENPVVFYPQGGTFSLGLIAFNPGGSDTLWLEEALKIPSVEGSFVETFEGGEPVIWVQNSPAGELHPWQYHSPTGCANQKALFVDNFQRDSSYWGVYQLSAWLNLKDQADPAVFFRYAYPTISPQLGEELTLVATDCEGESWVVFKAEPAAMGTAEGFMDLPFYPEKCADWAQEVVSLKALDPEKGPYRLDLRFQALGGQNFFLDHWIFKDLAAGNRKPEVVFLKPGSDTLVVVNVFPHFMEIELEARDEDGFAERVVLQRGEDPNAGFEGEASPYRFEVPFDQNGSYLLEAYAVDNEGLSSEPVFLEILLESTVSVTQFGKYPLSNLSVFPNPADKVVFLLWSGQEAIPDFRVTVYDALGKMVVGNLSSDQVFKGWYCGHLPGGSYYMVVEMGEQRVPLKFMIRQ
jgi:agmatine/peptidylarginine deiminase